MNIKNISNHHLVFLVHPINLLSPSSWPIYSGAAAESPDSMYHSSLPLSNNIHLKTSWVFWYIGRIIHPDSILLFFWEWYCQWQRSALISKVHAVLYDAENDGTPQHFMMPKWHRLPICHSHALVCHSPLHRLPLVSCTIQCFDWLVDASPEYLGNCRPTPWEIQYMSLEC